MRSEWRLWPTRMEDVWDVPGGQAHVMYPWPLGERVEHDDGTWSPLEFTYVERPSDKSLPAYAVECAYSREELVPRVVAFHVMARDSGREIRSADLRGIHLEDAVEEAWLRVSRRPTTVHPSDATASEIPQPNHRRDMKKTLRGLRRRARSRITPSLHEEVATVYRSNIETGAPTKAVAEHFGVAPSTASLYVKRARDAGKRLGNAATPDLRGEG
jgi:hypothetical protein